ncbi:hypothetical protein SODALDRAFT_322611 [Sodiomyces alkalinus F11]|uniref:Uncharacterized protein n=1 Tax=Sodiomyces alkalinus (strain CBS 110278 / VKM F-3762 / F11) TaxID=1314773 RepID=A0A3N2Q3Z6_SODAK|nr:hypothetical protein SODALDRAFT_322611 [Sodiomyces alkalinus F11]ROT41494.1 hypothetical protein SODALDRAFT_322611 [Sodiomyces alkalinus F11]
MASDSEKRSVTPDIEALRVMAAAQRPMCLACIAKCGDNPGHICEYPDKSTSPCNHCHDVSECIKVKSTLASVKQLQKMARDIVQTERRSNGVPCVEKRHWLKILSRAVFQFVEEKWMHKLTRMELDCKRKREASLEDDLSRKRQELEQVESDSNKSAEDEKIRLRHQLGVANREISDIAAQYTELRKIFSGRVVESMNTQTELRRQVDSLTSERDQLRQEKEAREADLEAHIQERKNTAAQHDDLRRQFLALQDEAIARRDEYKTHLHNVTSDMRRQVSQLSRKNDETTARQAEFEIEYRNIVDQCAALRESLARVQADSDNHLRELEARLHNVTAQRDALQDDLARRRDESITTLGGLKEPLRQTAVGDMGVHDTPNSSLDQSMTRLEAVEMQLHEATSVNEKLQADMAARHEQSIARYVALEERIFDLMVENAKLKAQLQELGQDAERWEGRRAPEIGRDRISHPQGQIIEQGVTASQEEELLSQLREFRKVRDQLEQDRDENKRVIEVLLQEMAEYKQEIWRRSSI